MWIWLTKGSIVVWWKIANFLSIFRSFNISFRKKFNALTPFGWLQYIEIPNTYVLNCNYFEKANLLPLIVLCTGSWTKITNRIMQSWMNDEWCVQWEKLKKFVWTVNSDSKHWAVKTMHIIIWILMNTKVRSLDLNPIEM